MTVFHHLNGRRAEIRADGERSDALVAVTFETSAGDVVVFLSKQQAAGLMDCMQAALTGGQGVYKTCDGGGQTQE